MLNFRRLCLSLTLLGSAACSSLPCANPGGPIANPNLDMHCASVPVQAVDPIACTAAASDPNDPAALDPNLQIEAMNDPNYVSPTVFANANTNDMLAPRYNSEGDDDDCKYHVTFSVDPLCQNQNVAFTFTVTNRLTGEPVTGAEPRLEIYLDDGVHVIPNSNPATVEKSPGNYTVGPIRFDAAGTWVVRAHLFENCVDSLSSPHGHVAFYLRVPAA